MSNKSNLSTILGVVGATVLAAGGSAFVTDTALNVITNQTTVQESEAVMPERESEAPITVETFSSTKDSFTVKPVSKTENNKKNSGNKNTGNGSSSSTDGVSENAGVGNSDNNGSEAGNNSETYTEGNGADTSTSSDSSSSSSDTAGSNKITYTGNGGDVAYYDEWGGWMSTNGDYYDGQGGYYDGNGYHYVGDSIKTPQGAANYTPSSGNNGSGNSSNNSSSGWDDSYFYYDTFVRYLDASEISGWSAYELAVARNEIFARHGRIFVTPEWSSYFAQKSWYTPKYENVDDLLNDYEWANLKLIMKREEKFY